MYKIIISSCIGALLATPSIAASDVGLTLHDQRSATVRKEAGLGAEMHVRIKLGATQDERITLGIAAGPRLTDGTGKMRTAQSQLIRLSFQPRKGANIAFAGQTFVTFRSAHAAEPAEKQEKKNGNGRSTLGWVGIGLGAIAGVGILYTAGLFATCNYSFTDNCRGPSD